MIKAEVSLNDGRISISPSGSLHDVLHDLIVFNIAAARIIAELAGEDEDEILDSVIELMSDQRDELRDLLFEGGYSID